MKSKFGECECVKQLKLKEYCKNILQAIEASEQTNLKEELTEAMNSPDPVSKSGMIA